MKRTTLLILAVSSAFLLGGYDRRDNDRRYDRNRDRDDRDD